MAVLESVPGFRRRFRLTPSPYVVKVEVEDDFHCMSVVVHHDGETAIQIIPEMRRAPWSTCPGAVEYVVKTFTGVALRRFAERGDKKSNCTHLYDLVLLAGNHAADAEQTVYDILVSDPVDGERFAEIRRNGISLLNWIESGFQLVKPESAAGYRLDKLRSWIDGLDQPLQEPARLLQWGNMLANGRIIPLENQSDATRMPPSCYTFQPERAQLAKRIGKIREFSQGSDQPLDEFKPVI